MGIEVKLYGTQKVLLPTPQRKNDGSVCMKEMEDGDWVGG